MNKGISKTIKFILVVLFFLGLVACSSKCKDTTTITKKNDPLEPINRGIYTVNKGLDNLYIRPVVLTYNKMFPAPIKDAVGNFIQNVNEVPTFINDMLQGKPDKAGQAIRRLALNSTLGLFGIFDVASAIGINRHTESLANTFVHWGYKNSTYLVLPILGPSSVRDAAGLVGNTLMTPAYYFDAKWRDKYFIAAYIKKRDEFLDLEEVIDDVATVDEYAFVRDAYFQKKASLLEEEGEISDEDEKYLGEPPE